MEVILAFTAFFVVLATAFSGAFTARHSNESRRVEQFLLGGRALRRDSVVNLLLSTSFGVNALLYAVWLGFAAGFWGFLVQAAWSISFFLLAPWSHKIRTGNSLHDFLGSRFGLATQIVASFCSIIGMMYLMGWEVGIAETTIQMLVNPSVDHMASTSILWVSILTVGIVAGALSYTLFRGIKGNAFADKRLNFFKILVVIGIAVLLAWRFFSNPTAATWHTLFPSFASVRENLGIVGLVTNVLFNLAWQFVDNSSWQSIIAGIGNRDERARDNVKLSGVVIFLTIGFFGTLIGILMSGVSDVTPNNILALTVSVLPYAKTFMTFALLVVIIACVMSLLDGLFLACAMTLVMDVFQSRVANKWTLDNYGQMRQLTSVRATLVAIALLAVWGVKLLFVITHTSLFDFVYIVILMQLALIGPVIVSLMTTRTCKRLMWVPIILALIGGFGSVFVGTRYNLSFLVDGAGTICMALSLIAAFAISVRTSRLETELETHLQSPAHR